MTIEIRRAHAQDGKAVAQQIGKLLGELRGSVEPEPLSGEIASDLLSRPDDFVAFLAQTESAVIRALTLSTCYALYAGGALGEIAELYVAPDWRSKGIGEMLVAAATDHCRARGWTILEVGAPPAEAWSRSVAFYMRNGFTEVGPRLHLLLDAPSDKEP